MNSNKKIKGKSQNKMNLNQNKIKIGPITNDNINNLINKYIKNVRNEIPNFNADKKIKKINQNIDNINLNVKNKKTQKSTDKQIKKGKIDLNTKNLNQKTNKKENKNICYKNRNKIIDNKSHSSNKCGKLLNRENSKKFIQNNNNKNKRKNNNVKKELTDKVFQILKKRNIVKFKIDNDKIKKIKNCLISIKYNFNNVKKCLVYSFFYLGNKNQKLHSSILEKNEPPINSTKLLENNENIKDKEEGIENIEDIKQENIINEKITLIKKSINLSINTIHKSIRISYPEINPTYEVKINSLLCDKCFRLIFIFFDYIKNYVLTYCSYCEKIVVYKYDAFNQKIKENKNPILDSCCSKCYKSFLYSDKNNTFKLIEKKNKNFIIICNDCLENSINKLEITDKCIDFNDLIEQKSSIYNDFINENLEQNEKEQIEKINHLSFLITTYESTINKIEIYLNQVPFSLKETFEKKILRLKQDYAIKLAIFNYYTEFNNIITRINLLSAFNSINSYTYLRLYRFIGNKIKIDIKEKLSMLNEFLNDGDDFLKRVIINEIKNYYTYSKLTKNYLNQEEFLEDKNNAMEEELEIRYENVLHINFITGEGIRYNINSENLKCEKIVPISYNYNLRYNSTNYQGMIVYNYKNDNKIYYAEYNIQFNELENDSLTLLINEPIINCVKIILINNGNDLFILGKETNNNFLNDNLNAYYICNFKKKPIVTKYLVNKEYKIIYNNYTICIQNKKKLMFMNRTTKKDFNISPVLNKIDDINLNNLGQAFIDDDINNDNDNNNNINNNNIINNINNNIINNNINDNIDQIILFQENLLNNFNGDMDLLIENIDNINMANLPPLHSSSIFQVNGVDTKSYFQNILKVNENYFAVLSTKTIKKEQNNLKIFFYLSLFSFRTLEELNKNEIEIIELNNNETFEINSFYLKEKKIKILINILGDNSNLKEHNFVLSNGELIENNN